MILEAEFRVTKLQTKKHQGSPEDIRNQKSLRNTFPYRARGRGPVHTLISDGFGLCTCERINYCFKAPSLFTVCLFRMRK